MAGPGGATVRRMSGDAQGGRPGIVARRSAADVVVPGAAVGAPVVHVHARTTLVDLPALQRGERAGRLVRVRRGSYVPTAHWDRLDEAARHVVRVRAVHAAAARPPVFSHWSAADVLGLPTVGRRDTAVHVVREPAGGGRSHRDVVRHAVVGPVDVLVVDGLAVTSAARTVVDLARVGGVVAGDAALRRGLATVDELVAECERAGRGRGVRAARRTAGLVDALSESPGESLSRVRIAEWGLPAPVLQHGVRDGAGLVGRVDFWWPHHGVAGEFDGRLKYGSDAPDVLWQEKLREDRLRATGLRLVRWTWQDAWVGAPLLARLHAAGVR